MMRNNSIVFQWHCIVNAFDLGGSELWVWIVEKGCGLNYQWSLLNLYTIIHILSLHPTRVNYLNVFLTRTLSRH